MVFNEEKSIQYPQPVDNDNINLRDILQYACNSCILWRAKKGLPKFDFRQHLGNPTYSSPNLATPAKLLIFLVEGLCLSFGML